jgi:hypothetical protein
MLAHFSVFTGGDDDLILMTINKILPSAGE